MSSPPLPRTPQLASSDSLTQKILQEYAMAIQACERRETLNNAVYKALQDSARLYDARYLEDGNNISQLRTCSPTSALSPITPLQEPNFTSSKYAKFIMPTLNSAPTHFRDAFCNDKLLWITGSDARDCFGLSENYLLYQFYPL
jgi:hypothetical protein